MKYTAQEMREAADNFWVGGVICEVKDKDGRVVKHIKHDAVIAMLRQAADTIDRLPSVIESRLGRAEKRQKHDLANELYSYLTWSHPIKGKPEVCFADLEKLGKLWERLRRDADSIESEWEVPNV